MVIKCKKLMSYLNFDTGYSVFLFTDSYIWLDLQVTVFWGFFQRKIAGIDEVQQSSSQLFWWSMKRSVRHVPAAADSWARWRSYERFNSRSVRRSGFTVFWKAKIKRVFFCFLENLYVLWALKKSALIPLNWCVDK